MTDFIAILRGRAALLGLAVTLAVAAVAPASAQAVQAGDALGTPVRPRPAGTRLGGAGSQPLGGPGGIPAELGPPPADTPAPRPSPTSRSSFQQLTDAIDRDIDPD